MYVKNTASQNLPFCLIKAADGTALTGATVNKYRSIDGAAQSAVTGTITELANGQYNLALSQADTNGDEVGFLFTATGAIPVHIVIAFNAANVPANLIQIGGAAVSTASAQLGVNAVQIGAAVPGSATIGTVTNLTNAPTAGDLTAAMKTSVTTACTASTPTAAGLTSPNAAEKTVVDAIKVQTDKLAFTVANKVDSNVLYWKGSAAPNNTGDPTALIGVAGAGLTSLGDTRLTNLDATISSRNATAPPTVIQIRTEMDANSTKLVNLDATVSSRNATAPPTVIAIRTEMDSNSTKLVNLDAAISTVATPANVLTQVNTAFDSALVELTAVPAFGAPPPTVTTLRKVITALFQYLFLKRTTTASVETLYKSDGATPLATSTVSDDTTTATHGKIIT